MIHPEEKSDADLLTYWQQAVDAALAQPVSNADKTSLHITAGELARLVKLVETAWTLLRISAEVYEDHNHDLPHD